mgnify:CR=1 FL=1
MWKHLIIEGNADVSKSHICRGVIHLLRAYNYTPINHTIIPNSNLGKIDDIIILLRKNQNLVLVNTAADTTECFDILTQFINNNKLTEYDLTIISAQRKPPFHMRNQYEVLLQTTNSSFLVRLFIDRLPDIPPSNNNTFDYILDTYSMGIAETAFNILKQPSFNL